MLSEDTGHMVRDLVDLGGGCSCLNWANMDITLSANSPPGRVMTNCNHYTDIALILKDTVKHDTRKYL